MMPILYLVLETGLAIVLVLGAHALRRQFGLGMFYGSLSFMAVASYWLVGTSLSTQVGTISFLVGTAVFFSAILVGVFCTYVLDGPSDGRAAMVVVIGVAISLPVFSKLFALHFTATGQAVPAFFDVDPRMIAASLAAIVLDLAFLAIGWEAACKALKSTPMLIKVFFLLLGVMWLDVIVFVGGAFIGTPDFLLILKGNLTSRFIVALTVSPFLAFYVSFQLERYGLNLEPRPLLAIFSKYDHESQVREAKRETSLREQELRESEARFEKYVSAAPDGIFIANSEGFYIDVNEAACLQTGYSRDELLTMHVTDLVFSKDDLIRESNFENLQRNGRISSELELKHKDGHPFNVSLEAVKLSEDHMMAFTKDITKRIAVEKALKDELTFADSAMNSLPGLFYVIDENGTFLRWNNNFEQISEYSAEEINEMHPAHFFAVENQPSVLETIRKVFLEDYAEIEVELKTKSGTLIPHIFNGLKTQLGNTTCLVGMAINISRLRVAEEERISLERQVQHAQKLESLGILAGGIAHDFNNILMAILGNADLALDEMSHHAPARENLKEIEGAARKAAGLAKQMLAYSGKGRFIIEAIDLNLLVRDMVHMLEVSISKKAVIKYSFADNLPAFNADATQVRQVIMNLITNASDATEDQSGIIAITTGVMECSREYLNSANMAASPGLMEPLSEGIYVYLEVADTGCGMNLETQERIFDPFYTTKFTGRGLGMAAVLGIVRGHEGAIKINSEVGKGSTIRMLFPADTQSENLTEQSVSEPDESVSLGGGTILLADDEESVRVVGKLMLQRLGFSVITVNDGRQAVEMFREHRNDVVCILLDLTMPHLGGEEAFRELRAIDENVKVILCSGYNEREATQHFTNKGLSGFIQKPFAMPELLEQLRKTLGD